MYKSEDEMINDATAFLTGRVNDVVAVSCTSIAPVYDGEFYKMQVEVRYRERVVTIPLAYGEWIQRMRVAAATIM